MQPTIKKAKELKKEYKLYFNHANFEELKGKKIIDIQVDLEYDKIYFLTDDLKFFFMFHEQQCCESVWIEELDNIENIKGQKILYAEEIQQRDEKKDQTWTFYKIDTLHSSHTLRWCGQSNGYYSESVDLFMVDFKYWVDYF